jgi:MFS family permease
MFLLTASVGLMFIGSMTKIAQTQTRVTDTAVLAMLVAFLAIMNTAGRVIGGMISDKIGRIKTLYLVFIIQMLNMGAFMFYQNLPMLILGIIGVGFCFGTLLSVFPALTADQYGLKNIGANYGIMFMAWGFAGVVAPVIANYLYDTYGNFNTAYIICAIMMAAMIFVNFLLQKDIAVRSSI